MRDANCTLLKWNASHFCSLVRFATIAIVGDSISFEQFVSLQNLLNLNTPFHNGDYLTYYGCEGQMRLVSCRSDDLKLVNDLIHEISPNILIIN